MFVLAPPTMVRRSLCVVADMIPSRWFCFFWYSAAMLKIARTTAQRKLEAATKVDLEHARSIIDDAARLLLEHDGAVTRQAFDGIVKKHVKVGVADDLAGRLLA